MYGAPFISPKRIFGRPNKFLQSGERVRGKKETETTARINLVLY